MADKGGRVVDGVTGAQKVATPAGVPTCFACGKYHGSVGAERHCLIRHLRAARVDLEDARLALSVAHCRKVG